MVNTGSSIKLIFFVVLILATVSGTAQIKDGSITKSIFFGGGSYYIEEDQSKDLGRWLDSIPNLLEKFQIQIISHTDNIGGWRYNKWLSEMRSQMVHGILIQKDIPEKIIHIKDWGLENPVYSNDSYQGLRMNRRVDVVLHPVVF